MTSEQPLDPSFAHTDPPSWTDAVPSDAADRSREERRARLREELRRSALDWDGEPSTASHHRRVDWVSDPLRAEHGTTATAAPPRHADEDLDDLSDDGYADPGTTAFDDERMLTRRANSVPAHGWRRLVTRASGGLIRPGPSQVELRARRLVATVSKPVGGSRTIAVVSTKGGVGKTTTTINLGHTFAAFRGDRVVALDGNPDAGSLAYRIQRETKATVSELLADLSDEDVFTYTGIRRYTSQASSRLEVIASPEDPRVSRALGKDDYQRILQLLRRHFTLILADCGTGILDPVTQGIVESAQQLIVVTAPAIAAARAVSFLLSWLTEHGFGTLVENAVLVINAVPPRLGPVNLPEIERHFAQRVRTVVRIPWDEHLETGARTSLDDLAPATRDAYVRLAASVADGFGPSSD
jgi:putative peptide zinc metalloprotease protein